MIRRKNGNYHLKVESQYLFPSLWIFEVWSLLEYLRVRSWRILGHNEDGDVEGMMGEQTKMAEVSDSCCLLFVSRIIWNQVAATYWEAVTFFFLFLFFFLVLETEDLPCELRTTIQITLFIKSAKSFLL